jgi:hypothetical protein
VRGEKIQEKNEQQWTRGKRGKMHQESPEEATKAEKK